MTVSTAVFSAARIAEILSATREAPVVPTPEQRAVIEHPLGDRTLVLAGAGSGKTETMANRVVWLVANGLAAPTEVLGLTFTRKAAGELSARIADRLLAFGARLREEARRGALTPAERERADRLDAHLVEGLELPEVRTYNAYASGIVQEFGPLAGLTATGTVIEEAAAWRLAREIVCASHDSGLADADESIATLVGRVLRLDHEMSDHLTTPERVEVVLREFRQIGELPYNGSPTRAGARYREIDTMLHNVEHTSLIVRLAREFSAEKQRRGVMEFSDQLRLAIDTLDRFPRAVDVVRRRTPIVLLDEVQDTSVGQTRLLSRLFAGASVMAVGDPHQSIYGFRGASAQNLHSFHRDFGEPHPARHAPSSDDRPQILTLSVSWRNPAPVLAVANELVGPLSAASALPVPTLRSRPHAPAEESESDAGESPWGRASTEDAEGEPAVESRFLETTEDEAETVAQWLRDARAAWLRRTGSLPTAAVVCRSRRSMPQFQDALVRLGVPARIVGVGGLLTTPEVTEVVSVLRCLWYADAGSDLIRVLTSPRFRVGPADIAGLRVAARWFAQRDIAHRRIDEADRARLAASGDEERRITVLDAIDLVAGLASLDHAALEGISPAGRERLREAGRVLRQLRQGVGGDLLALVRGVEVALRLDIELDAHESAAHDGSASARANLDAFAHLVEQFLASDRDGTLASLLAWLERAAELDQAAEHVPEPVPGTVHLITVHGAKGLEWDLVAVPRLVVGEFPVSAKAGLGWLRPGELPDEMRGDAAARPSLDWRTASTQQELLDRVGRRERRINGETVPVVGYADDLITRHEDEERRLAYVAVTRARARLLMTGAFWGTGQSPRDPSPYLRELAAAGLIDGLPTSTAHATRPAREAERSLTWPLDPLGARRPAVLAAAETVRAALQAQAPSSAVGRIDPTVQVLLAERDAPAAPAVDLPGRVTASTFHEFIAAAAAAERERLRPVPRRPFRRTRVGNRFHEWVERRSTTHLGTARTLLDLDPDQTEADDLDAQGAASGASDGAPDSDDELDALIAQFERSRFAGRQPVEVEREVTLPFAGRRLVCKLDAVYRDEVDGEARYEVVDWKTGRAPRDDAERRARFLQLELYRHAYARWAEVDPALISVSLFYVAEGVELCSPGTHSFDELESLWLRAAADLARGTGNDR